MSANARTRGLLFAIGGREAREGKLEVLGGFVRACGGTGMRLAVLTAASRDPDKRVREYGAAFRSLGVEAISFHHARNRDESDIAETLGAVAEADAVFFAGGNQLKLVSTLGGTRLERSIRERHAAGLHIGGTSAGASAMTAVMIARGHGRSNARLGSVRMTPGFGLHSGIVIDQHFRERDRFGRLFAAVACNPRVIGLGLDEDTAIRIDASDRLEVLGSGTLTVVDGAQLVGSDIDDVPEDAPAAFAGMQVHVLTQGWSYDLAQRATGKPPVVAHARAVREGERETARSARRRERAGKREEPSSP